MNQCYDCLWRRDIVGDCHSECTHPEITPTDKFLTPLMIMNGLIAPIQKKLNVYGIPHGIKKGWFMWPLNFDPVWLISCGGFERKEVEQTNEKAKV